MSKHHKHTKHDDYTVEEFHDKWGTVRRVEWIDGFTRSQTEWPSHKGRQYIKKHGVASPADRREA